MMCQFILYCFCCKCPLVIYKGKLFNKYKMKVLQSFWYLSESLFLMMKSMLYSVVSVTRLQDCSVVQGEVIALVTVHGRVVLVDEDGHPFLRDKRWFSWPKIFLLAQSMEWPLLFTLSEIADLKLESCTTFLLNVIRKHFLKSTFMTCTYIFSYY